MSERLDGREPTTPLAGFFPAQAARRPWSFRFAFRASPPPQKPAGEEEASTQVETIEALELGKRRRLVIQRENGGERLVLIGGANEILIETGFGTEAARPAEALIGEAANPTAPTRAEPSADFVGLLPLGLMSIASGVGIGVVCGLFRIALHQAQSFRAAVPDWLAERPIVGCVSLTLGAAVAAGFSAWLVRRIVPSAAGSGIPHVESVIAGEAPPAPFTLVPVKFVGGLLAIGAGLALGREGPLVQMGATCAFYVGKLFRCDWRDSQSLLAAGAGAGLAAAFNAPLAGSAFVLEELLGRFDMRHATAALGASVAAIMVVRLMDGASPEFAVAARFAPTSIDNFLCLGLGVAAGVMSVAYSGAVLGALDVVDRFSRWPAELKAALIGAAVGALAWFAPGLVGDGGALTQQTIDGRFTLVALVPVFLLRFGLGAVSYAAGTPGGLFAPLLALGAQLGSFFGLLCFADSPEAATHASMFAIVGMAAFFSAVVRAPLTGMILITEMTESSELLLPMLAACFSAMATATLLRNAPIYDALRERAASLAGRKGS